MLQVLCFSGNFLETFEKFALNYQDISNEDKSSLVLYQRKKVLVTAVNTLYFLKKIKDNVCNNFFIIGHICNFLLHSKLK